MLQLALFLFPSWTELELASFYQATVDALVGLFATPDGKGCLVAESQVAIKDFIAKWPMISVLEWKQIPVPANGF